MTPSLAPTPSSYAPHDPSHTMLSIVVADHLKTFLASLEADPDARGLPAYVQRKFYDYVQCGIRMHGFVRLGCDTCKHEMLLAFSCKRRGFCPSCAGRRIAHTAAHLVEQVIPWVPTRQWVVSAPVPLRYWMVASQDLTATVHTIIRTTIGADRKNNRHFCAITPATHPQYHLLANTIRPRLFPRAQGSTTILLLCA